MSDPFLDRFLNDYYAECDEHLATIRRGLLALEASVGQPRPDASVTEELFRSFHSIKGIAGMVEHRAAELLAHEMESYLRALRDGQTPVTTAGVEELITGARLLEQTIRSHREGQPPPDASATLAGLSALTSDREVAAPSALAVPPTDAQWRCVFTPSPALPFLGGTSSPTSRLAFTRPLRDARCQLPKLRR